MKHMIAQLLVALVLGTSLIAGGTFAYQSLRPDEDALEAAGLILCALIGEGILENGCPLRADMKIEVSDGSGVPFMDDQVDGASSVIEETAP